MTGDLRDSKCSRELTSSACDPEHDVPDMATAFDSKKTSQHVLSHVLPRCCVCVGKRTQNLLKHPTSLVTTREPPHVYGEPPDPPKHRFRGFGTG